MNNKKQLGNHNLAQPTTCVHSVLYTEHRAKCSKNDGVKKNWKINSRKTQKYYAAYMDDLHLRQPDGFQGEEGNDMYKIILYEINAIQYQHF